MGRTGAIALALCLGTSPAMAAGGTAAQAHPPSQNPVGRVLNRGLDKNFADLTPSERIALKAQARTAYKPKILGELVVCADPGNMPFSHRKLEGFENKIAELLGKATGAKVRFYWRPSYERGLTREPFSTHMCDAMIDIPTSYTSLLTTEPIYRTTYVLAYRNDRGIHIKNFDDPELKKLKIGVYQTSNIREVSLKHGIFNNVSVHVDGKLDIAAVWGPFAGWAKAEGEPITIQPVNLWEDTVPLEFDLAIGVRKTDGLLKYILDDALDDHRAEITKILKDYGVPLVNCSRCVVQGDLPAHGGYIKVLQASKLPLVPSSEKAAALKQLKARLAAGADPNDELSDAIIADDPARVKFLVSKGANVNAPDNQGYTPLTSAARQRYTDMIKVLLALKANVNTADANNMTPLLEAVMRNDVPSIKVLLAHGADKEVRGPQGYNSLALAIEERQYEAAKTLIDAGAKVNVAEGDQRLTPLMITAAESAPPEGAIFVPSSTRPIDIAKLLIKRGADVTARDKNGMTALMVAASHDNAPMVGLLLQSGADVAAKNKQGETALDIAKLNGSQGAARAITVLGKVLSTTGSPTT
jgi:quinoprotein dehydrogenase-associated probable ABC transporter substrate-binding protein